MQILLFLSADETAAELAASITAAATRVDAGPTAWRTVRDGEPDIVKWLKRAEANRVQLVAIAAAAPEAAGTILDKTTLAILVTDLTAGSVQRARDVSATLEKTGVALVMLAKATDWNDERLAGGREEAADEDNVDEGEEADDSGPAGTVFALVQFGTVCPVPLREPAAAQAAELWAYIAQRLDRLAARRLSQGPDNSSAAGRRFPRWSFDAPARLSWENHSISCRVDNVSAGGLGLYVEAPPAKKTLVNVEIAGFAPIRCAVASISGQHVGVSLDMPLVEQIRFVRRMAALIAASASGLPRQKAHTAFGHRPRGG